LEVVILVSSCISSTDTAGLIVGDLLPHSTYGPLLAIAFAGVGLVIYNVMRKSKMRRESNV